MDPSPKTPTTSPNQTRAQVFRAAGLVGGFVFLSRFLGLARDIITKQFLAVTTIEATAYDAANRFPEAIFLIIAGGAIGSAFIPTFAAYFARGDEEGGWRLFSAVINLMTFVVTAVAAIVILFAPQFVDFFLADLVTEMPEIRALTVRLMRIMLLSTIIFGASGVVMGALNARQHFLLPAIAPVLYNLGIIAGILLWVQLGLAPEMGLAYGTILGAAAHFLVQLPGLRQKQAKYTPILTLKDPGVRQVIRLMAPRVLGLSFSELNKFIMLFLTGSMTLGSYPALNTAFRLIIMPQGILGQALGIAAFPTLSTLAAKSAWGEMRQIITDALRLLIFLGIPATVLLVVLREPFIVLLYQRGIFGADDTALVMWALLFLAWGLVALTALEVIARAFYALSDTLTPVLAGGMQMVIMAVLSLWLSRVLFPSLGWLPLGGVALGFSLSNYLEVGLLLWLLRRRMGGINGRYLLDGLWRMSLAGLAMGSGCYYFLVSLSTISVWLQALGGIIVGGVIYLVVAWILQVAEIKQMAGLVRRRLR